MEYIVRKLGKNLGPRKDTPAPFGIPAGPDRAAIASYSWDTGPFRPESEAYVGWDESGLRVWLCSDEKEPRALCRKPGDPVWEDSCLEFFLSPEPEKDGRYLNFECSASSCVHLAIGPDRNNRRVILPVPDRMRAVSVVFPGTGWCVHYTVSSEFLKSEFGITLRSGLVMSGNFYKCGDRTPHPHFGSWSPIDPEKVPAPDFHRPEYFGRLFLE